MVSDLMRDDVERLRNQLVAGGPSCGTEVGATAVRELGRTSPPVPRDVPRDLRLMVMLERVGFGWLRRGTVVAELERMWAISR